MIVKLKALDGIEHALDAAETVVDVGVIRVYDDRERMFVYQSSPRFRAVPIFVEVAHLNVHEKQLQRTSHLAEMATTLSKHLQQDVKIALTHEQAAQLCDTLAATLLNDNDELRAALRDLPQVRVAYAVRETLRVATTGQQDHRVSYGTGTTTCDLRKEV